MSCRLYTVWSPLKSLILSASTPPLPLCSSYLVLLAVPWTSQMHSLSRTFALAVPLLGIHFCMTFFLTSLKSLFKYHFLTDAYLEEPVSRCLYFNVQFIAIQGIREQDKWHHEKKKANPEVGYSKKQLLVLFKKAMSLIKKKMREFPGDTVAKTSSSQWGLGLILLKNYIPHARTKSLHIQLKRCCMSQLRPIVAKINK